VIYLDRGWEKLCTIHTLPSLPCRDFVALPQRYFRSIWSAARHLCFDTQNKTSQQGFEHVIFELNKVTHVNQIERYERSYAARIVTIYSISCISFSAIRRLLEKWSTLWVLCFL